MKIAYSKFKQFYGVVLAIFLLTAGVCGVAVPLAEYRLRLAQARKKTETFRVESQRKGVIDKEKFEREIRKILPETLVVADGTDEITASNLWLSDEIARFEKSNSFNDQDNILKKIAGRLNAVENRLDGAAQTANNAESNNSISKAEARAKLQNILKRVEYKNAAQDESILSRWWKLIKAWFSSLFEKSVPNVSTPTAETTSTAGNILQYVVIIAAAGIVGFLIWRFSPYFRVARLRSREKYDGTRVILGETIRADEDSSTLWSEAERLAAEGNRRAAIRKGYIATLCELGDRRIVRLEQHKTNGDYLKDVRRRENIYTPMRGLTSSFERHWYGDENADENAWAEFRKGYGQVLKTNA